jgi:hypothetical protein
LVELFLLPAGVALGLLAGFALGRRRSRPPALEIEVDPAAEVEAAPPAPPPPAPAPPIQLPPAPELLATLKERNRRLTRDTKLRMVRGKPGPT